MARWAFCGLSLYLAACGGEQPSEASERGPKGRDAGTRDAESERDDDDDDDEGFTVGDLEGCRGKSVSAPRAESAKVDIVWVIDASASMLDEQKRVGENLAKFAADVAGNALDLRIVMLTTSASVPVICPLVPADPLAGTALATDPRYRFIETRVDSSNALDQAVQSYPKYADFLRPDAALNFVFLSDDESRYKGIPTVPERVARFTADMESLAGKPFTAHTISSEGPKACNTLDCMPDLNTGLCAFVMLGCGAAEPGTTYYALADETGGVAASICESDWSRIFGPLTEAVVRSAPLPCSYEIPAPPAGEQLDPERVNVGWRSAPGAKEQFFPKGGSEDDCGREPGWYYDDPARPQAVQLCPAACRQVAQGGTLSIAFGCAPVLVL